jgi:hypothetical protein
MLNENMKNFNNALKPLHEFHRTADTFRKNAELLGLNNREINRMTKRIEKLADTMHKSDAQKFVDDTYKNMPKEISKGMKGAFSTVLTQIGDKLYALFQPMIKFASGLSSKIKGMGGAIAASIAAAIGLTLGRVIDSSPLLQAVLKIMNTSMTLILRPIGDLVGSILRPLALYFLKDVAIPFFKAFQPLSRDATQLSRGLASLLLNPINMISASIIKGMKNFFPPLVSSKSNAWSKIALEDPARMTRRDMGIGEFRYGGGSIVPMVQELNKIGATGNFMNSEGQMQGISAGGWTDELRTQMMDSEQMIEYDRAELEKLRLAIFDKHNFQLSEAQSRTGLSSGKGTTIVGQGGAISEKINPIVTASMWEEIEYESGQVLDSAEEMSENIDNASTEFENISDTAITMKTESDNWWDALVNAWNGLFISTEETTKEADDWWGTQWSNLEQWGQDTWSVLFDWKVGQQAFAEEMDQSTHEIERDMNKLDKTLDKGTFDIGTAIWDGLNWMGETISNGIFGFGESIDSGITWLSELIHGSGTEINHTLSGLNYSFATAEEAILTAANLATGNLYNPNAASNQGGTFSVGSDSSGMNYSYTSPAMSSEAAKTAALKVTGGQPLGDVTGNRFEFSPGKFGDIYRGGEKMDPTSEEGQKIQKQYQQQLENRIANDAQRGHFNSVRDLSTAAEAQAYVMAGGGEEGLKAAAYTKQHNVDLQTWEGLSQLGLAGFAEGHEHVQMGMAETAAAKQLGLSSGWSAAKQSAGDAAAKQAQSTFGTAHGWGFSSISSPSASSVGSGSAKGVSSSGQGGARSSRGSSGSGSSSGGSSGGGSSGGGSSGGGSSGSGRGSGGGGAGSGGSSGSSGGSGSKGSGGGKGSTSRSRKRQFGGIIDEPILGVGLQTGDLWSLGEDGREIVTPEDRGSVGGVNVLNINVGNITKEADYLKLKPLVQRWMLEAASRRGNV